MKNILRLLCLFGLLNGVGASIAEAKLKLATTTTDLAAIARSVGGDQVEVFAIAKGTQDPHQIEAKPSFMVKLRDVDLIVAQGLELESAWLDPLIRGSRNPKLNQKSGVLELAGQLQPLEVPKGAISRAEGDVHPGGNPHFQLDPIRLGQSAVLIAERLSELEPANQSLFMANATSFQKQMEAKTKVWQERVRKTGMKSLVTYHKDFSYFCDRFGLSCEMQIEPKPGIPPTVSHLAELIEQMRKQQIHLVLVENYFEDSFSEKFKSELPGLRVERVAVSVGGEPGLQTNADLIEALVVAIEGKGH